MNALRRRRQARERLRQATSRIRASNREIKLGLKLKKRVNGNPLKNPGRKSPKNKRGNKSGNRRTIQKKSPQKSRLTQQNVEAAMRCAMRHASADVQANKQPQTAIHQVLHPNVQALQTSNQDLHTNAQALGATTAALVGQFQTLQLSGASSQPSQAYMEPFQATIQGLLQQSSAQILQLNAQSQETEQDPHVNNQALQASSPATQHSQGHQSDSQTIQEETQSQTTSAQTKQSEDSLIEGESPLGGGALPEGTEPGQGTGPGDSAKPGNDTEPGNNTEPDNDTGPGNDVESGDNTEPGNGTKSVRATGSGDITEPSNGTESESATEPGDNIAPDSVTQPGDNTEPGNGTQPKPDSATEPGDDTQPSGSTELGRKLCANRTDGEFNHPYWYFDDAKPDNIPAKKWESMRLWRRARRAVRTRIYDEWMNNALRLAPVVQGEKLRGILKGILNLKPPTLPSEVPVLSLLAIKYFITSLLDLRMKRLMMTEKYREKDLIYARRNEFTRYVYSDQFLCFDYTVPEGETTRQRLERLERDCLLWHKPYGHEECYKTSEESTDFRRATLTEGRLHAKFLMAFTDYPSQEYGVRDLLGEDFIEEMVQDTVEEEHRWWYSQTEEERWALFRGRLGFLATRDKHLGEWRRAQWAKGRPTVEEEYPDADEETLSVMKWMWYHRLIGNRYWEAGPVREKPGVREEADGRELVTKAKMRERRRREKELKERREAFMASFESS